MARQAKTDLSTKTARKRLTPRKEPYYSHIAKRKSLGYHRTDADIAGSWLAREKIKGKYGYKTFATADDHAKANGDDILTYEDALQKASHLAVNTKTTDRLTVKGALDAYFVSLAGRSKHADHYRAVAKRHITTDDLLGRDVDRLTKTEIEAWQAGLVEDEDEDDADARRRSQDTANRILTILKAALNAAFDEDTNQIPTDAAWRRVKPFQKVARPRTDHFEGVQVSKLITSAREFEPHFADLIEVSYLCGARPGELFNASVRDFDAKHGTLKVDGKTDERVISLTRECVAVLQRIVKDRAANAPLLPRADGERWKNTQHRPMRRALAAAGLPESASLYTLRHSYISRAIEAGMPLSLIVEQCGTSLTMIERNYAKVLARTRRDVIEETSPRLYQAKNATVPKRARK